MSYQQSEDDDELEQAYQEVCVLPGAILKICCCVGGLTRGFASLVAEGDSSQKGTSSIWKEARMDPEKTRGEKKADRQSFRRHSIFRDADRRMMVFIMPTTMSSPLISTVLSMLFVCERTSRFPRFWFPKCSYSHDDILYTPISHVWLLTT